MNTSALMITWIFILLGTIIFAVVSRKTLLLPRLHGFYRFFA